MDLCGHRHFGVKKLLVGALLLVNAFVWPKWLGVDGWIAFVAVLMVIGGLVMVFWHPQSNCCSSVKPAGKPVLKKRRK